MKKIITSTLTLLLFISHGLAQNPNNQLLIAITQNNFQTVQRLIANGADVNARDSNQATVLMHSVYRGNLILIKHLIENGAKVNLKGRLNIDSSEFYYGNLTGIATGEQNLTMLKYLIDHCKIPVNDQGYNIRTLKPDGWTALHWASYKKDTTILKFLINKGANVNFKKSQDGLTPLALACLGENLGGIIILLRQGVKIDHQNPNGYSALHFSIHVKNNEIIKSLVSSGAKVNIQDKEGFTPLMLAVKMNDLFKVRLLIQYGASDLTENKDGKTAIDIARDNNNEQIVSFLENPDQNGLEADLVIAYKLFQDGNYSEAGPIYEKYLPELKITFGENDTVIYIKYLISYITCLQKTGQLIKLLPYMKEFAGIISFHYGDTCAANIQLIRAIAQVYKNNNQTDSAILYFLKEISLKEIILPDTNTDYIKSLSDLAFYNFSLKNYKESRKLLEHVYNIKINDLKGISKDDASLLNSLGLACLNLNDMESSERYYNECLKIIEEYELKNDEIYWVLLGNMGFLYRMIGEYDYSKKCYEEVINSRSKNRRKRTLLLAKVNLADLYQLTGNHVNALKLIKSIHASFKKEIYTSSADYIAFLTTAADVYAGATYYIEAINTSQKVLSLLTNKNDTNNNRYAMALYTIGESYFKMGQYEQSIQYLKRAELIIKEVVGINSNNYGSCVGSLGLLYKETGNFELAEYYLSFGKDIFKNVLGTENLSYCTSIKNLAQLYIQFGQYYKAFDLYKEALEITEKVVGENSLPYAEILSDIALLNEYSGYLTEAADQLLLAKSIMEKKKVIGTDYALVLGNLGLVYNKMQNYQLAEEYYSSSINIKKRILGDYNIKLAGPIHNLALLYHKLNKIELTDSLLITLDQILEINNQRNNPEHTQMILNEAIIYESKNHIEKANQIHNEIKENTLKNIKQQFSYFSETEKEKYLNRVNKFFYAYQSFSYRNSIMGFLNTTELYDIELNKKSMILNSVEALRKSIYTNRDTQMIDKYNEYLLLKSQISKLLIEVKLDSLGTVETLENKANSIEKELARQSKEFSLIEQQFEENWKDVQNKLRTDEASIEFVKFPYLNINKWTDSTLYCALILRKEFDSPKMVYLFEENQLSPLLSSISERGEEISKTYSLTLEGSSGGKIYNLIWEPLEPYLDSINKINISASGELNRLAFHAIQDRDGDLLSNKYDLAQLTSTREVVFSKPDKSIESVAILGGIDYSLDTAEMIAMAQELNTDRLPRAVYRGDTSARGFTLTYLPGTLEEARRIEKECISKDIKVQVLSGKLATEDNFSLLEENGSPDVIHIATHGFYFPKEKTQEREERMRFMQTGQENPFIYSPDPLIRSGLALAGSNHAWKGEKIPEGVEDGILTARDVSRMNLMNTELVVLSACQTGLGDVKGSEGVYGFQRAFKMAGVRYILVSLWKVPDESTKEFMVTFYKQLLSGKPIRESYHLTQQVMSAKYPDDPFKWAAFVLVE